MTDQKGMADDEQQKQLRKRPADDTNAGQGGRNGKQRRRGNNSNNNRNNRQNETPEEGQSRINAQPCNKHNGEHLWGKYPFNKKGNNY